MSEGTLSVVLTVAIAVAFLVWIPFLNFICPPCARFLERHRDPKTDSQPLSFGEIRRESSAKQGIAVRL